MKLPGRPKLALPAIVVLAAALLVAGCGSDSGSDDGADAVSPPPANAAFDYQISGDYPLPKGVTVVSRDWFIGEPAPDPAYSICYVNAFQTQADEGGTNRPDAHSNWPQDLVLNDLGDDPNWGGEYVIDLSTAARREAAAEWVQQMIDGCAEKGFDAIEFDNLDSWTRFDGTPLEKRVPFGKPEALAYAKLLAERTHEAGLAAGQKNAADITPAQAKQVGFDFAIAEECSRWDECDRYQKVYGDKVIEIEYRKKDFDKACATVGPEISVVYRDLQVSKPDAPKYVYDNC